LLVTNEQHVCGSHMVAWGGHLLPAKEEQRLRQEQQRRPAAEPAAAAEE
jgi:hypothetical protein